MYKMFHDRPFVKNDSANIFYSTPVDFIQNLCNKLMLLQLENRFMLCYQMLNLVKNMNYCTLQNNANLHLSTSRVRNLLCPSVLY